MRNILTNSKNNFALSLFFFCLTKWYNVQLASFKIFVKVYLKSLFVLVKFTLKEEKAEKKHFFYEKMRH